MENKTNGLSIGGMVVGIIAIILAIIPCTMIFGGVLGLVGLILSIIGYRSAKDSGGPTTMGMAGIILSALAIIVAVAWGAIFAKAGSNIANAEPLNVETCDEVLEEMRKTVKEMNVLEEKGDDVDFGDISSLMKATTRFASIQSAVVEMSCNDDPEFKAKMEALEESMEK